VLSPLSSWSLLPPPLLPPLPLLPLPLPPLPLLQRAPPLRRAHATLRHPPVPFEHL
jgi:hypothetical protein